MDNHIVVVNSTPIILLHKVGQLDLLRLLYSKVYIPQAVYKEVVADYDNENDFISAHDFIDIVTIQNAETKRLFSPSLHDGETETIMLGMEMKSDLCVLDDLLARKYAKNAGFNITGTLGILLTAKNKGHINEVKPIMDKLIYEGMYVDEELYSSVLALAKEV